MVCLRDRSSRDLDGDLEWRDHVRSLALLGRVPALMRSSASFEALHRVTFGLRATRATEPVVSVSRARERIAMPSREGSLRAA